MKTDKIKELRKKAMALPLKPGVYIMKNKMGVIIYIGKAKKLKNRVSQYFGSDTNHSDKVIKMVSNVEDFEYIICDSEFEALILECSLIKQYQPKYNILLKDSKGYHYIKISKGQWPKIKTSMNTNDKDAEYLGPYNSAFIVKETVDEAVKIFKLPQCDKQFPRDIKKVRPCLNYYIGNCSAPCGEKIKQKEYYDSVMEAIDFIKDGSVISIGHLEEQMEKAAENLEFEKAAKLRDRISAIKKIKEKQKVISSTYENEDVLCFVNGKNNACVEIFAFRNFRLSDRKQYIVEHIDDFPSFRSDFLKQYYLSNEIPQRIVIDDNCEDRELLEEFFSKELGKKVEIIIPQIGEQRRIIEMCLNNASEYLAEYNGKQGRETAALYELATLLNLETPPEYIESYDISHTAGSENVAGMIVFKNGLPYKSAYKRFKIKSFIGQDDCRSMQEVIERRFTEYLNAQDKTIGFGKLPDLILLDGGVNQVNAVKSTLNSMGLEVNVFGMVKDSKHKTNAITANGNTVAIKSNRAAYTLVSNIQEEVHRFAISYHRKLRNKSGLTSSLLEIKGVGKATSDNLLKHFKTIKNIKNSSIEELCSVKGISKSTAINIYNHFNSEN